MSAVDGRTRHYGAFYGIDPLPTDDGRPLAVVWGNCQAEALRLVLDAAPSAPVRTVRTPPVHEFVGGDVPHLRRLLASCDLLLAQPIAPGYRGLPLGTSEVAQAIRPGGRTVRWPVLFDAALYPFQVLVRHHSAGDPPVVPYHDLRTVVEAATGTRPATPDRPEGYRRLARRSQEALAAREATHDTVRVSDRLERRHTGQFHTINHPGNAMLLSAAHAIQELLGGPPDAADPGRVLLRAVLTPQEPAVLDALGVVPEPGRGDWLLAGTPTPDDQVRAAHLAFYDAHPGFVAEGLRRHAATIELLGLA